MCLHIFLTSALDRGTRLSSCPVFNPVGNTLDVDYMEGWAATRVGLYVLEISILSLMSVMHWFLMSSMLSHYITWAIQCTSVIRDEICFQLVIAATKATSVCQDSRGKSDDKSHLYWAKGTGFGTGSTAQSWNVEQALLRQRSEEEHVTVLLQVNLRIHHQCT